MVDANRNILAMLISLSAKTQKAIDFEKSLAFPLYSFPLCLAYPDGTKQETQKSKLLEVIAPEFSSISNAANINRTESAFVIDMIAQLRVCVNTIPETFEDFILKFLQSIPKGYKRIDIVADTYRDNSIKGEERAKR